MGINGLNTVPTGSLKEGRLKKKERSLEQIIEGRDRASNPSKVERWRYHSSQGQGTQEDQSQAPPELSQLNNIFERRKGTKEVINLNHIIYKKGSTNIFT